jgi:hypothetical protein
MNTKSLFLSLVFGLLLFTTFQSCKKYEDGPALSFRSRTARLCNTWKVDNYKVNESDFTSLVSDYSETFSKDGNYSFSWGNVSGTGKWTFQNDDKEVRITGVSNKSSETLFILKLEEKSLWYYYMDGSNRKELHMIQR